MLFRLWWDGPAHSDGEDGSAGIFTPWHAPHDELSKLLLSLDTYDYQKGDYFSAY